MSEIKKEPLVLPEEFIKQEKAYEECMQLTSKIAKALNKAEREYAKAKVRTLIQQSLLTLIEAEFSELHPNDYSPKYQDVYANINIGEASNTL